MKAMIFAAGKGTRLKPLTESLPKALVKVNGITLLEHTITKLKIAGITDIIVNVHHFANQVIEFLQQKDFFGINIHISDESNELLDTGGGLKKASWFFNDSEPILLHNVDIMSNIDINAMLVYHKETGAIATLAVRKRESGRYLLFNGDMLLSGWKNNKTGETIIARNEEKTEPFAFSGVHIVNPELFQYLKPDKPFSIIDTYLEIAKNKPIKAYLHPNDYWFDIGKTESLKNAQHYLAQNNK